MIVYGRTPRTKQTTAPKLVQDTPGMTLKLRADKLRSKLASIDRMLDGCTDKMARMHLTSARNSVLGSLSYCEAYVARTNGTNA